MQAAGLKGCAPQKCFVDNIEAWSANEMAINWNAATQASGAFQLIAISLADQASMLSTNHFCGAQPGSPAAST